MVSSNRGRGGVGPSTRERVNARAQQQAQQPGGNGQPRGDSKETAIRRLLEVNRAELELALPKHMDVEKLLRVSLTTIKTTPALMDCSTMSLISALMQAAQLGLQPGLLGHAYLVPYKGVATLVIGYRGMIDLARRSGEVASLSAHEVFANDFLDGQFGTHETLVHVPWYWRTDGVFEGPGELRGAYCVAKFKDGGHHVHYMPLADLMEHRARSQAAERNQGPWRIEDGADRHSIEFLEMCKKTTVRMAWKWWPISVDLMAEAEAVDEKPATVDLGMVDVTGEAPEGAEVLEPEVVGKPEGAPEQPATQPEAAPAPAQQPPQRSGPPGIQAPQQRSLDDLLGPQKAAPQPEPVPVERQQ